MSRQLCRTRAAAAVPVPPGALANGVRRGGRGRLGGVQERAGEGLTDV